MEGHDGTAEEIKREFYVELARETLDQYPGGLSRTRFAQLVFDDPAHGVQGVIGNLRKNATEVGRTVTYLKVGGEWIIAWADSLHEHLLEQAKRRKNERASLRISLEMLDQSCIEQPDSIALARMREDVRHRLNQCELNLVEAEQALVRIDA